MQSLEKNCIAVLLLGQTNVGVVAGIAVLMHKYDTVVERNRCRMPSREQIPKSLAAVALCVGSLSRLSNVFIHHYHMQRIIKRCSTAFLEPSYLLLAILYIFLFTYSTLFYLKSVKLCA